MTAVWVRLQHPNGVANRINLERCDRVVLGIDAGGDWYAEAVVGVLSYPLNGTFPSQSAAELAVARALDVNSGPVDLADLA